MCVWVSCRLEGVGQKGATAEGSRQEALRNVIYWNCVINVTESALDVNEMLHATSFVGLPGLAAALGATE